MRVGKVVGGGGEEILRTLSMEHFLGKRGGEARCREFAKGWVEMCRGLRGCVLGRTWLEAVCVTL